MPNSPICSKCGLPLSDGTAEGLCLRCLLESALAETVTTQRRDVLVSPANGPKALHDFGSCHTIRVLGEGGMGTAGRRFWRASSRRARRWRSWIIPTPMPEDAVFKIMSFVTELSSGSFVASTVWAQSSRVGGAMEGPSPIQLTHPFQRRRS
jgi:hypothetical protein